jgi:putative heme iron utilization protein
MTTQTDFWLYVHRLAESYKAAGKMPEKRAALILDDFNAKSPEARQELIDELVLLGVALGDLHQRVTRAKGNG